MEIDREIDRETEWEGGFNISFSFRSEASLVILFLIIVILFLSQ